MNEGGNDKGNRGRGGGGGRGGGRGGGGLIQKELLETKSVDKRVYIIYAKAVGLWVAFFTFFLQVVTQVFSVGTNFWLAKWSDDPNSATPSVRDTYLGVYGGLGAGSSICKFKSQKLHYNFFCK